MVLRSVGVSGDTQHASVAGESESRGSRVSDVVGKALSALLALATATMTLSRRASRVRIVQSAECSVQLAWRGIRQQQLRSCLLDPRAALGLVWCGLVWSGMTWHRWCSAGEARRTI